MTYLLDRKVTGPTKWYTTRRRPVLAIVVHVTAGLEDLDATDDQSAERTAAYAATTDRSVSWHSGSDTDTALDLLPASYTAFHCRDYNSSTYGHEISKRTTDWAAVSKRWRDRTLCQAATHLAGKVLELGVPIRKATPFDLDAAIARFDRDGTAEPVGFIGHWELDPSRRSDPGLHRGRDTFPWHEFLDLVRVHANQEADDMDPRALVVLTYNAILGRNPESLEVIAQGAAAIANHPGGEREGQNAFVASVANSDEAKARRKS